MILISRIGCLIPTYNAGLEFERLVASLKIQSIPLDVFVVDSSSSDDTANIARAAGFDVVSIPQTDFDHGGTRQLRIDQCPGYDFFVLLTQDVILASEHSIRDLVAYFQDENVGAVCGRQLPHSYANRIAQHARYFNYPEIVQIKSIEDVPSLGIKTAFMSNAFSAYRIQALEEVGGFPSRTILSEDMFVAARMLLNGWKLVYAGDACCYHSHNYSLFEEGRRYFDIGVFHARARWIRERFGGAGGEGWRYVRSELRFLGLKDIMRWPEALLRNGLKLLAYKLGQLERWLPRFIKRRWSLHRRYWDHIAEQS